MKVDLRSDSVLQHNIQVVAPSEPWSGDGFREGIQQATSLEFMNTENLYEIMNKRRNQNDFRNICG